MKSADTRRIGEIVNGFVKEAEVDYVGLWEIAKAAREQLGARTSEEVRQTSLQIVKQLYENGLRPGDYDYGTHMEFWPDDGYEAVLGRIEREWTKLNSDPTHLAPICSFLRPRT
ncbi:MAG: hypothetical protein JO007_17585 [Alphaproteobacteria bacterium]|nr:hypothetical protein [Alphaproteobacteria bacterium]